MICLSIVLALPAMDIDTDSKQYDKHVRAVDGCPFLLSGFSMRRNP